MAVSFMYKDRRIACKHTAEFPGFQVPARVIEEDPAVRAFNGMLIKDDEFILDALGGFAYMPFNEALSFKVVDHTAPWNESVGTQDVEALVTRERR